MTRYNDGYWVTYPDLPKLESCPESKDGKHDWEVKSIFPSAWNKCSKCKNIHNTRIYIIQG